LAIALDNTSKGTVEGSTSLTVSHTVAGSNRVLYVYVCIWDATSPDTPTATYNGVSMTSLLSGLQNVSAGTENARTELFRLIAPATGTHDIVVTITNSQEIDLAAISLTGVHQTTPENTPTYTEVDNAGSISQNVSSATDELVLDGVMYWADQSGAAVVGGGQTDRVHQTQVGDNNDVAISTEPGATTVTMSWTWASGVAYAAHIAWAVKPTAAAVAIVSKQSNFLTMFPV